MVSRRTLLHLAAVGVAGTAGCVDDSSDPAESETPTTTPDGSTGGSTPGDAPRTTPREDLPERSATWTVDLSAGSSMQDVNGLTPTAGGLVATVSGFDATRYAAVDTETHEVRWKTDVEGRAARTAGPDPARRHRGRAAVTGPGGSRLYGVTESPRSEEWTAVHALDRATGERAWSRRESRALVVRGGDDEGDTLFVTGEELFTPEHSHDTPEGPLKSVLYALDASDGTTRWTREFLGVADVAVSETDRTVYVAAADRLVALGFDGTTRWSVESPTPTRRVLPVGDRVYLASGATRESSTVRGLTRAGEEAWTTQVQAREFLRDGTRLYAVGDSILALATDGSREWRTDGPGRWPLLGPGGELVVRSARQMDAAAVYEPDGTHRWTFDPPSQNAWPVATVNRTAFVEAITPDRPQFTAIYAVEADSGRATETLESRAVLAVAGAGNHLYVGGDAGRLSAFAVRATGE